MINIQHKRTEGHNAELLVINDIKKQYPKSDIKHHIKGNIDIVLTLNNINYFIEVKSCKKTITQKYNNKLYLRLGTFYLKKSQISKSDFFAFVIRENSYHSIYYVKSKRVSQFLRNRKPNAKRFAITIPQLFLLNPKKELKLEKRD